MTTKHTPVPWKAVYVGCGDWDISGPVTEADWKLAAAAPKLLKALKKADAQLLKLMPLMQCDAQGNGPDCTDLFQARIEACAAIAEATGEIE